MRCGCHLVRALLPAKLPPPTPFRVNKRPAPKYYSMSAFHRPYQSFGSALTEFSKSSSETRSRYRFWSDDTPKVGISWAGTRRSSQFSGNPTSSTKQQDICGWSLSSDRAQDCWWNNKEEHSHGRFERKCRHSMWSCRTKKSSHFAALY